jgi:hypothetical protein
MAKKIVRLTESDLNRLVKRILRENPIGDEPLVNKTNYTRNNMGTSSNPQIEGGSYPPKSINDVKREYGDRLNVKTVNVDKFSTGLLFDMSDGTKFSVKCK